MSLIIFCRKTSRILPYLDEPQLFEEEYVQQTYSTKYNSPLIFLDSSKICRVTMRNILLVDWATLDLILDNPVSIPTHISKIGVKS